MAHSRSRYHRIAYILLLAILGSTMICSMWIANLAWVLLIVNWMLEGRWSEKLHMARSSQTLHVYLSLLLLFSISMLWTSNLAMGWATLQVSLPLIAVPLVILTTKEIDERERQMLSIVFVTTVIVVSVVAVYNLFSKPDIPYRQAVPHISHIRFALFCCMVIAICIGEFLRMKHPCRWLLALVAAWLLVFLLLIRSFTALVVLAAITLVVAIAYRWGKPLVIGMLAIFAVTIAAVGLEVKNYYTLIPQATEPLVTLTANGRPYEHACDGIIENGNYTNNYICRDELRTEWNRRSTLPYDHPTAEGYSVESTLIRYLASVGLTRDSIGVWSMNEQQIASVEKGVANAVYEQHNPVKKMVYVMLFEYEYYKHTDAVEGFTMLQRLELWKATCRVIGQNPWFGVGTGDAVDAMHAELKQSHSRLAGTTKRSHDQYLTIASMIGLVGLAIIILLLVRAIIASSRKRRLTPLMTAWIVAMLISFITEDTLDTTTGVLFCTWFLSLRGGKKTFPEREAINR